MQIWTQNMFHFEKLGFVMKVQLNLKIFLFLQFFKGNKYNKNIGNQKSNYKT